MSYIDTPNPGDPLRADWARSVAQALRENRVEGGPGIRVTRGPMGTLVEAAEPPDAPRPAAALPAGADAWIGVISHDQSGNLVATAVSANGPALPAILNLTDALVADDLPDGSQVIIHPIAVRQYLAEVPA